MSNSISTASRSSKKQVKAAIQAFADALAAIPIEAADMFTLHGLSQELSYDIERRHPRLYAAITAALFADAAAQRQRAKQLQNEQLRRAREQRQKGSRR